jgi:hypothetical protein
MPLSVAEYFAGVRTWDAARIPQSPFYQNVDRAAASLFVRAHRLPVLRPSSVPGYYAVTYLDPNNASVVVNTLLRQSGWAVEAINSDGVTVFQRFENLYMILDALTGSMPTSGPAVATPAAPVIAVPAATAATAVVEAPPTSDPAPIAFLPTTCAVAARTTAARIAAVDEDPCEDPC